MDNDLESAVARHYGAPQLADRILQALAAAGLDIERLTPADLAPVDEFHIGGRVATKQAVEKLGLQANQHVVDVGCGIGGASRYLADRFGCRVTGIDLTPEYIAVAQLLAARTGLGDRLVYKVASALELPFPDAAFDAAITLHVAMNIKDRPRLYGQVARVLKPDALFCVYDVMQGPKKALAYPVPWAQTSATSHLETPGEMRDLLNAAGFDVVEMENRSDFGLAFFRERLAAATPPPLSTNLLMGNDAGQKFHNVMTGLEDKAIVVFVMIARKRSS